MFLRAIGRSPATIRAYSACVDRYLAATAAAVPDSRIDPLQRYVALRRDVLRPASLNIELSALKAWFAWLRHADPEAWQPTSFPRRRRPPARPVRALSDGEMGMLLAAPDLTTFVGLRDHLIIATLYQCGLRAGELAALQIGSVRLDGFLLIQGGKGGHDRYVPYGGAWYGLLETYLQGRAALRPGKRNALFLTRQGRPLRDARSVWVIVNRYARRALGTGCGYARLEAHTGGRPWQGHYPHMIRASFATALYERGVNLVAIAQMLGHADVATTAYYLGVSMEHLRRTAALHPRATRDT